MSEVVRYQTRDGGSWVLVEVDAEAFGVERVGRAADGVHEAGQLLAQALAGVRDAAGAAMDVLKALSPDGIEMEFGVKLAGEAGAIIAKTSGEAHFKVKLTWSPGVKA
jgi:hypothetical protein